MVLYRRSVEAAVLRKESEPSGILTFKHRMLHGGTLGGVWGLSKDGPAAEVFQLD